MGASACSDAERMPPLAMKSGGMPQAISRVAAAGAAKGGSSSSSSTIKDARHWHDKMRVSAASQALFVGAQVGDARRVVTALSAHGDPNCVNFAGYSPLMLAVGGAYREVVALLLQAGGDPNYCNAGVSPLMIAAASGQLEVVRMLVNCGADSNTVDSEKGHGPLHRACLRGHNELTKLLVQAGASVDLPDFKGVTSLMLAAGAGYAEVCTTLFCAGAAVHSDKAGNYTLTKCILAGHETVLGVLLKAGAPVNAASRDTGETALIAASRLGHESMVRALLQYQANVNILSQRRETALMLAAKEGSSQVCQMLLLSGADTTLQDINGYTALMHGAASGGPLTCTTLLDYGACPQVVSPVDASTPLTLASVCGQIDSYRVLITHGAQVGAMEETHPKPQEIGSSAKSAPPQLKTAIAG